MVAPPVVVGLANGVCEAVGAGGVEAGEVAELGEVRPSGEVLESSAVSGTDSP